MRFFGWGNCPFPTACQVIADKAPARKSTRDFSYDSKSIEVTVGEGYDFIDLRYPVIFKYRSRDTRGTWRYGPATYVERIDGSRDLTLKPVTVANWEPVEVFYTPLGGCSNG